MTGSVRIFEKLNFTPKLSALAFLKVKLPNMTDWHIFSVSARKLSITGSIRNFEKINFTPKSSVLVSLKVKLPNMTDWHIFPGLKIDVLIASPRKPSVAQGTVPVVIYRSLQQT